MSEKQGNSAIKCPYLLLCEGVDEYYFLITYLNNYLIKQNPACDNIEVRDFGGNEELEKYLKSLSKMDGFEKVKSIAVIRDAEKDCNAAKESLERIFCSIDKEIKNVLSEEPYYLLPHKNGSCWQNGTLEDLCIKILKDNADDALSAKKLKEHAEAYAAHIEADRKRPLIRKHKNLLHTYLSGTDKYVGMKIGEAAKSGCFDWESNVLADLKNFILTLVKD